MEFLEYIQQSMELASENRETRKQHIDATIKALEAIHTEFAKLDIYFFFYEKNDSYMLEILRGAKGYIALGSLTWSMFGHPILLRPDGVRTVCCLVTDDNIRCGERCVTHMADAIISAFQDLAAHNLV